MAFEQWMEGIEGATKDMESLRNGSAELNRVVLAIETKLSNSGLYVPVSISIGGSMSSVSWSKNPEGMDWAIWISRGTNRGQRFRDSTDYSLRHSAAPFLGKLVESLLKGVHALAEEVPLVIAGARSLNTELEPAPPAASTNE